MVSGIWRLTGLDALDRATWIVVDPAALDLAEVQIVDSSESAQQLAVGSWQGLHLEVADVMDRARLQVRQTNDTLIDRHRRHRLEPSPGR